MKRPLAKVLPPLLLALLASCGGPENYAEREAFASDARYRRDYTTGAAPLCDAARRAMLGDGYVVGRPDELRLIGGKQFQVDEKQHAILMLYVHCDPRAAGSTLFVTATEERFDVKATRQSSSLGFPLLAPLYFGTLVESDNQVKIRGETVTQTTFYERFQRAVERELAPPR